MTELQRFEDVLMLDTQGNVVYTAFKGVDLGANLLDGPYRLSNLADAYRQVMSHNIVGEVVVSDFAAYSPSLGNPAGWAVTPIAVDDEIVGALAIELPIDRINGVMTVDGEWDDNGLGATGETYSWAETARCARSRGSCRPSPRPTCRPPWRAGLSPRSRSAQRAERQHPSAAGRRGRGR